MREYGPREVGVALEIKRRAADQLVDVGVTAGAEEVVDTAAILVYAVVLEGVLRKEGFDVSMADMVSLREV